MSLLREIQDAAVDGSTSLAVVLRKCMVLAARLGHEPFKRWVDAELNGYPPGADLPPYRHVGGIASIGTLAGPLGAMLNRVPLPLAPIPADVRDHYDHVEFREGVAKLEEMARPDPEGRDLVSRWSGDLIAQVADKYYQGYRLLEAYMEIPKNAVVGVLDVVRNKALKFALEIEEEAPAAGETSPGTKPVPDARVAQIFNTFIMGGAQNVAVGSPAAVQHAQQIQAGDLNALKRFLIDRGLEEGDVAELEAAIGEDPPSKRDQPLGKRVSVWLGNMATKAASGAWKAGTAAASDLLTAAVKAYYGLP